MVTSELKMSCFSCRFYDTMMSVVVLFLFFISFSVQILNNVALVYSAVVLFGMKSEEFSVKVHEPAERQRVL